MKILVVITAFFLLLKPVLPLVEYALDYDYISTVLCENQAKPEMHCNGKCHLMKELAKASENEKPASQTEKKNGIQTELFCNTSTTVEIAIQFGPTDGAVTFFDKPTQICGHDGVVFRPPILA